MICASSRTLTPASGPLHCFPKRLCEPAPRRRGDEVLHRGLHAFLLDRHAGELEPHLDAGERAHQREVVEIAEMADAEHLAARACPGRCRATCRSASRMILRSAVGVVARPASARRSASRSTRADRRTGSRAPRRAPRAASPRRGARGARTPLSRPSSSSSIVERLAQAVEQVGRRRVREVAGLVGCEHLVPVPVASAAASRSCDAASALSRDAR